MEIIMASFHGTVTISVDHQSFAFELDATFRGLTISRTAGGYNVILRGLLKGRIPVYAMTVNEDIAVGLESLVCALSGSGGAKLWHFDKFANSGSQRPSSTQREIRI